MATSTYQLESSLQEIEIIAPWYFIKDQYNWSAMGTRNLICVYHRGHFVIAQYSQWDGYPEGQGQGMRILKFLWGSGNIERLKEGLQNITTLTDEGVRQLQNTVERDLETEKSSYHDGSRPITAGEKIIALWPSLSRDTGAKILEIVAQATAENNVPIVQTLDFANDGLFCKWAYVIDLDQNAFEVFGSCERKQEAVTTRFNGVGGDNDTVPALIKSFSLSQLPSTEDEFIDALDKAMTERKCRLQEELMEAESEGVDEEDEEGEGENSEAGHGNNNEKEVDKKGGTNDAMEADKWQYVVTPLMQAISEQSSIHLYT